MIHHLYYLNKLALCCACYLGFFDFFPYFLSTQLVLIGLIDKVSHSFIFILLIMFCAQVLHQQSIMSLEKLLKIL